MTRCYACDRKLGNTKREVFTCDHQMQYVGSECFKHIDAGKADGWQPPKGGPRLYLPAYTPAKDYDLSEMFPFCSDPNMQTE